MGVSERLRAFLDQAKVKYAAAKHPTVYTAQEIAASQHVPGRQLAKCVLVNTNRGPLLAVLPAIHRIDVKRLKTVAGAHTLTIAKEDDIKRCFPDVEVGAMSPFGTLYAMSVIVDRSLGESEDIVFNAGSHTDTIRMRYRDFAALVKPKVGSFGQPFPGATRRRKPARRVAALNKRRPTAPRARRGRKKPSARKRS